MEKEKDQLAEGEYRSLFEANPYPMWVLREPSQPFLAVNDAAVERYGYSREEFRHMSLGDIDASDGAMPGVRKHRTKGGSLRDTIVLRRNTSFGGASAILELLRDLPEQELEHSKALRTAEERNAQLHQLTVRTRSAHEEERTRVARYLHDEVGQMLTALRMTYGWMAARLPEGVPVFDEKIQSCVRLTEEAAVAVQRLSTDLRPGILDLGLGAAIDWHVREFETRSDIECTVQVCDDDTPVDPGCATEMYRIYEEAMSNVARHSGASRLDVLLIRADTTLILEVTDNGRGITPEQRNSGHALGLLGMHERAALIGGTIWIEGSAKTGTTVRLTVPLAVLLCPA